MLTTKKILIVDDVAENIVLLQSLLDNAGYTTQSTTEGSIAIKLCNSTQFDLMLIDVRMPDMDGFETAKCIRNNTKNFETPILFLLVKTDEENKPKAFINGGVDIITKPFYKEELLARINTHIIIQEQHTKLVELNITKDRFISILAHDLRNPFNSLIGFSDMLQHSIELAEMDKIKKYAEIIQNTSKNTFDLLNNLLSWAYSQQQGVLIKKEHFNLYTILKEILLVTESIAEAKNIEIYINSDKNLHVLTDKEMLKTILRNLITNAIKFSFENTIIKIKTNIVDEFVEITISDNGIGMDENTQHTLFNILDSKSNKGTKGEVGTGFGLILCKEYVEKNGGKIWVESILGKGSDFIFSIPFSNSILK
ncbi:MAG TPA: hybrid sensor histidine kinase/response regulator [Flavobacteriaceae bacterium]|nr:hybrid sensor histidine kinase/response regulator [Flavobacteriaceae bacterium]